MLQHQIKQRIIILVVITNVLFDSFCWFNRLIGSLMQIQTADLVVIGLSLVYFNYNL